METGGDMETFLGISVEAQDVGALKRWSLGASVFPK